MSEENPTNSVTRETTQDNEEKLLKLPNEASVASVEVSACKKTMPWVLMAFASALCYCFFNVITAE